MAAITEHASLLKTDGDAQRAAQVEDGQPQLRNISSEIAPNNSAPEEDPPAADCEMPRNEQKVVEGGIDNAVSGRLRWSARHRPVTVDTSRAKSNSQVVSLCANRLGFVEYPRGRNDGKPCDIYWHNIIYSDMRDVIFHPLSKVNKFPGMNELAKKIPLTRAIGAMQRLFPSEYDFYPRSWFIPAQLDQFHRDYRLIMLEKAHYNDPTPVWFIVKPDEGAQGVGIYLMHEPSQLQKPTVPQLIQEYVADPFLLPDHLKFDFRVYGVIKSINPLSVYVAREGMARFCTAAYRKPSISNSDQVFVHLTNYSLNKGNSSGYVHSNTLEEQLRGSKRLLSTVFHQMEGHGIRTRRIWHDIKLIIVKTVLAMVPELMLRYEHHFANRPQGPQCFQILGFDVLLTRALRPILLEVNASPSLTIGHSVEDLPDSVPSSNTTSIVDEVIKVPLVNDCLLLVIDQMDNVYNTNSGGRNASAGSGSALSRLSRHSLDDSMGPLIKRKAHLTQIFPARYGENCWQLLFLDKAVYLYLQFINVKKTVCITSAGFRLFARKCSLVDVMSPVELERKYAEIETKFAGHCLDEGVPFHGFLDLLFEMAVRKYLTADSLVSAVQSLLTYCDTMLRHYGVRSARLRREVVVIGADDQKGEVQEIYLLPSRATAATKYRVSAGSQRKKNFGGQFKSRSRSARNGPVPMVRRPLGCQQLNGAVSLPRIA